MKRIPLGFIFAAQISSAFNQFLCFCFISWTNEKSWCLLEQVDNDACTSVMFILNADEGHQMIESFFCCEIAHFFNKTYDRQTTTGTLSNFMQHSPFQRAPCNSNVALFPMEITKSRSNWFISFNLFIPFIFHSIHSPILRMWSCKAHSQHW